MEICSCDSWLKILIGLVTVSDMWSRWRHWSPSGTEHFVSWRIEQGASKLVNIAKTRILGHYIFPDKGNRCLKVVEYATAEFLIKQLGSLRFSQWMKCTVCWPKEVFLFHFVIVPVYKIGQWEIIMMCLQEHRRLNITDFENGADFKLHMWTSSSLIFHVHVLVHSGYLNSLLIVYLLPTVKSAANYSYFQNAMHGFKQCVSLSPSYSDTRKDGDLLKVL